MSIKTSTLHGLIAYAIFLQSLIAMLGSLYYSTFGDPVKNFLSHNLLPAGGGLVPCELCWFARILTYPIVILSLVGMLREDHRFTDYILPLTTIGIFLESFHYALQKLNIVNPFGCTLTNPCNALQVQYLGFITIPFLSLTTFVILTALCVWNMYLYRKQA